MRPAKPASLLVLLLAAAVGHADQSSDRPGRRGPIPKQAKTVEQRLVASWEVPGFGETLADAEHNALKDARSRILEHFHQRGIDLEWDLSLDYISARLVRERMEAEPQPLGQEGGPNLGVALQRRLRVELTKADESEILKHDREFRVGHRQESLLKMLAGIVALLTAVSGYFRLEEATKGYYTAWLRLAAVTLVAGVGTGLWWIS
jgi:hypothetical protein